MKSNVLPGVCLLAALSLAAICGSAQTPAPTQQDPAALAIIQQVGEHELAAYRHHGYYSFLNAERSDRTNQHLWLEAVVETPQGKFRRLLREDGQPLAPQRRQQEDARIAAEAADPAKLEADSHAREQDEQHAQSMFNYPPQMFVYAREGESDGLLKISFRPNPAFQPSTYEQRVLHAMAGSVLIEPGALRLRQLDARITEDVKFGWGIIGEILPGGNMHLVRVHTTGDDYKPTLLDINMQGHLLFFHTLSRTQHLTHRNFAPLPPNLSVSEAGKMALAVTP